MAGEQYGEFIDAESGFMNEKDTYDALIVSQIKVCVDNLSKEMIGGHIQYKKDETGVSKYVEDVRELIINSVDTLKMLLVTYMSDDYKKILDKKLKEIENYKAEIMSRTILTRDKGYVKVSTLPGLAVDHPLMKEFLQYKALKYRDIFELLVNCYNKKKAYLKSLEFE
jgi:hypothetical protein